MSCDIILSVCGRADYLPSFLDSLAEQRQTGWRLLYRFDGEPDPGVLRLMEDFPRAAEVPGRAHLGIVGSYRRLLRASDADCFFPADQDDVWHADKLSVLLAEMKAAEGRLGASAPILLHSDLRVIDRTGGTIAPSLLDYQALDPTRCRLRDLLVQNNVTGCAALGNRALRELASALPDEAICHDWYLALAAAAFGHIGFVGRPLVDYRQHDGNVYGAVPRSRLLSRGFRRAELHGRIVATQRQAAAFLAQFGDRLSSEQRRIVAAWSSLAGSRSYAGRLRKLLRFGFRKNDALRTLGMVWAL